MKQYPGSFSKRLTNRIIPTVAVTMAIVAVIISHLAVMGMSELINGHFQDVMEITNDEMDYWLSAVEISAANIEDELEYNLASTESIINSLKDELRLNPSVSGAGIGFIPYYFPEKGRWYEPYVTRTPDGKTTIKEIGSQQHDYLKADWYLTALNQDGNYWSDPYIDPDGAEAMLCTYSMVVRDLDGKPVGVLGADLYLEWLKDQVQESDAKENRRSIAKKYPGDPRFAIYSFIIDRGGTYIVHPEAERILAKSFFDYAGGTKADEYKKTGYEMLAGHSGWVRTPVDGHPSFIFYAPLERTGWSMGIVVPALTIYMPGITIGLLILMLLTAGVLIIFLVCRTGIRRATKPLEFLAASAGEIAKGNFDTKLPDIGHQDEISHLRDSFEDMQHSLSTYVDQLTSATAQRAAMESELSIASGIQMSMLPKTFPPYPERQDIDIFARLTPAKVIGGDLYDFFIRDEKLFFCIGDVSGKGIPAAIVMSAVSTQFRALSAWETSPEALVSALNKSLCERNESMMFVTFFCGVLNLKDGSLHYCNAGHDAPLLLGRETSFLEMESNLPLGVEADWAFKGQRTHLAPGTTILLYTDGLTEAEDLQHALFGKERITKSLSAFEGDTPQGLIEYLSEMVSHFTKGAEQSDDLTMLAIQTKG